jgi:deoxyribonuclease IV
MRYLGIHASASGGIKNAITAGNNAEVNAIQTMFSAPMRWSLNEIKQENIDEMAVQQAKKETTVKKILFHGVYLTNLARKDKQKFHLSKMSQQTHLDAAQRLQKSIKENDGDGEVLGVTFHPGSALDLSPEEGIKRISQGLNWILKETPGEGLLLLETTAGAGNVMGAKLEDLKAMRDGVEEKARIGFVADTQHMFASGYDWINDLEGVIEQLDEYLGIENIKAFHLNDSAQPFASNKDRHANLGAGEIGETAIRNLLNHPKLVDIPFILETPAMKSTETIKAEVAKLKDLID